MMTEHATKDQVKLGEHAVPTKNTPLSSPSSSVPASPVGGASYLPDHLQTVNSKNRNESSRISRSENVSRAEEAVEEEGEETQQDILPGAPQSHGASERNASTSSLTYTIESPSAIAPPQPRRSSFGLSFLSSLTNSIRNTPPQHQSSSLFTTQSPQSDPGTNFMSNSPTIANLNNYTSNDEAGNSRSVRRNISSGENAFSTSSSNSDFEHPTEINIAIRTEGGSEENSDTNDTANNNNTAVDINDVSVTTNSANETTAANESSTAISKTISAKDKDGYFSVRLTPLIDHSSSASGLYFSPIIRKLAPNSQISIGRYTEKNKAAAHAPQGSSAPIVFKSKVVSRTHALFSCNEDGQWFLKDCKSSSGTFLNHIRLSPASQESTMMPLIDGDIIQLGMDYRGGTEEVYRCVKMRCEFNKSWQRKVNQFNLEIHKKLKNLHVSNEGVSSMIPGSSGSKEELSECAICLLKLEPCQALFISPCSHSWHYKCIRPVIIKSYPQFYCPNCRSMCDLETDIEEEEDDD